MDPNTHTYYQKEEDQALVSWIHLLLSSIVYRLLSIVYRLSSIVYRLSTIVYRLSSIVYRLSSIDYRLSSIVYRLSPIVCSVLSSLSTYSLSYLAPDYESRYPIHGRAPDGQTADA